MKPTDQEVHVTPASQVHNVNIDFFISSVTSLQPGNQFRQPAHKNLEAFPWGLTFWIKRECMEILARIQANWLWVSLGVARNKLHKPTTIQMLTDIILRLLMNKEQSGCLFKSSVPCNLIKHVQIHEILAN